MTQHFITRENLIFTLTTSSQPLDSNNNGCCHNTTGHPRMHHPVLTFRARAESLHQCETSFHALLADPSSWNAPHFFQIHRVASKLELPSTVA